MDSRRRVAAPAGGRGGSLTRDRCLDPEEFLRAERDRLWLLLADAIRYGAHHTGVSDRSLLETLAETRGIRLEEPAWIRARQERRLRFLLMQLERTSIKAAA